MNIFLNTYTNDNFVEECQHFSESQEMDIKEIDTIYTVFEKQFELENFKITKKIRRRATPKNSTKKTSKNKELNIISYSIKGELIKNIDYTNNQFVIMYDLINKMVVFNDIKLSLTKDKAVNLIRIYNSLVVNYNFNGFVTGVRRLEKKQLNLVSEFYEIEINPLKSLNVICKNYFSSKPDELNKLKLFYKVGLINEFLCKENAVPNTPNLVTNIYNCFEKIIYENNSFINFHS
jgi:hypothetical protein